ncbi:hypothetical protein GCM10007977_025660 [Dactylosporangium sucinum]|uniref:Helix-turn-helix domain-containing protein n=2 Tax=Dactylosporangium sucinum TaxID=1424081 RepID=A0A917TI05_9ACTN|nr:hypothetical protein GCM10007977_025660 [Dactylosporangium sucinum]
MHTSTSRSLTGGAAAASAAAGMAADAGGSAGGERVRQFPAWLDRNSAPAMVAYAAQRWPWTIVDVGSGPASQRLIHGDPRLAAAVGAAIGDPVTDAEAYAEVWRLSVSCRWPGGHLPEVAGSLATAGIGRRPGALIINLDAGTTQTVLANGWVRSTTMRQMLAQLDEEGLLGRLRPAASGGLGCYALTMPLPPLFGVPTSAVARSVSATARAARDAAGDPPVATPRTAPRNTVSPASGGRWALLSPEQRAALTRDVVSRYEQGASVRAVSGQTGLPCSRVYTILVETATEMRPSGWPRQPRDDAHTASVVSRYGGGMSIRMIAGADRISYRTVMRILNEAGVSRRRGPRRRSSPGTTNDSDGPGNGRAEQRTTSTTRETRNGEGGT